MSVERPTSQEQSQALLVKIGEHLLTTDFDQARSGQLPNSNFFLNVDHQDFLDSGDITGMGKTTHYYITDLSSERTSLVLDCFESMRDRYKLSLTRLQTRGRNQNTSELLVEISSDTLIHRTNILPTSVGRVSDHDLLTYLQKIDAMLGAMQGSFPRKS